MRYLPVLAYFIPLLLCISTNAIAKQQTLTLNEQEYFEKPGLNILVFNNWYNGLFSDAKMSGVEMIHHGVRTVTNGDVRLNATPEQWDPTPEFIERKVDAATSSIEAFLQYPAYNFQYSIRVQTIGDSIRLSVNLSQALPSELIGKAGLNLEFLPPPYIGNGFIADGKAGIFPMYPSGVKEVNGETTPTALATGNNLILAPGNVDQQISIQSQQLPLSLYDGRSKAQNGWYVVRSLLPEGKTGTVLEWTITAATRPNWLRAPMIAHSQVGYHPKQKKIATIELDKNTKINGKKTYLYKITDTGEKRVVLTATPKVWGRYKRYNYLTFDFTKIAEQGLYVVAYDGQETTPFKIANDVYSDVWQSSLNTYLPIQMDHMLVNEAYRVWHGASHLDDALQAPINHTHFDLYAQGPTTDTRFKPGEHIPGLNIGGWYDAGDYDIRTQTQYHTVANLVSVWDNFKLMHDTTTIDYSKKLVELRVPDGKPDLLQQIEHGTLALISQFRAVGHAIPGIIVPDLSQYTHLGDGLTMTDNLIYDAKMSELETNGFKSGKFDDRWAFTSESSALNYGSIGALAAASRALKGYDDSLSKECLTIAKKVWSMEQKRAPKMFSHGNTTGGPLNFEKLSAATELLVTSGEEQYSKAIEILLPEIQKGFPWTGTLAIRSLPFMSKDFQLAIRELVQNSKAKLLEIKQSNPFGVLITEGGWAGNGAVIGSANTLYYMHKAFPDLIDKEQVFDGLNYIYGHHPGSNISFVSNVGTRSKKVAYGMNRADYSFIAGGVVPGVLILKPDFPENKDDWPFLWGENEYVVDLASSYIFLANAVQDLLMEKNSE